MEPSLDFLLRHARRAVPRGADRVLRRWTPSDIDRKALGRTSPGCWSSAISRRTLEIALRLQPRHAQRVRGRRGVARSTGNLPADRASRAPALRKPRPPSPRSTALPMDDAAEEAWRALPPHSVVYYLTVFADGAGRAFVPHEALSRIAGRGNAPVYVVGRPVRRPRRRGRQRVQRRRRTASRRRPSGCASCAVRPPAAIPAVGVAAQSEPVRLAPARALGARRAAPAARQRGEFRTPFGLGSCTGVHRGRHHPVHAADRPRGRLLLSQSRAAAPVRSSRGRKANRAAGRAEEEARRQRDELAHAQRVATLGELTASFAHELNQPLDRHRGERAGARASCSTTDRTDAGAGRGARRHGAGSEPGGGDHPPPPRALQEGVGPAWAGGRGRGGRGRAATARAGHAGAGDCRRVRARELPPVLGDGVQLRQVVINLLVNAEEAIALAGDGPREVRVETVSAGAAHVGIAVRDSGIGLKESELKRMFGHFVSNKPQGLGMGLAISRSIVEAHGGRIWATRNEARGLTLHIELPAAATTHPERAALKARGTAAGPRSAGPCPRRRPASSPRRVPPASCERTR